tara:strand:+ start:189 stop:1559 length:1371 start_codon:yes stop_codon:yes gene_type:complete
MTKNKDLIYTYIIFISVSMVFLDAYEIFSIPLTWLGLSLLVPISLYEIKNTLWSKYSKFIYLVAIVFIIPEAFYIMTEKLLLSDLFYIGLRYYNIFSFIVVLFFCNYFFQQTDLDYFFSLLKKFIYLYSFITIYIFIAQIFDFYEPFRNRPNTTLYEGSLQSIFWLSQPHRAMGTFREPLFLVTFFLPLVLIYLYRERQNSLALSVIAGIALGLTRSDYVRLFVIVIFLYLIINYVIKKEIILSILTLLLSIVLFSSIGVLECNLNPDSIECSEFSEDVEKINNSGKLKIKTNSTNPVTELDSDRLDVINYFLYSLNNVSPRGIGSVNEDYQDYSAKEIGEKMYLTNRTLPKYLLTRYSTQNFGTGNYSLIKYEPNVQNLLVFYTQGFGVMFPVLLYLYLINLLMTKKINLDIGFFSIIILLIFVSPIEEVNSYYAFIIGLSYTLYFKKKEINENL